MLTLLSMTTGEIGGASGIPDPICSFLRVEQMVGAREDHKYPREG
jgi:hypothetical protein